MFTAQSLHRRFVHARRVRRLAELINGLIDTPASILDVGCGDGRVSHCLQQFNPQHQIHGIDVLIRASTLIPATPFDGHDIPFPDGSFDTVLLIDVLHHADDPERLLQEAIRVSRRHVIVKDHYAECRLDDARLRLMDWVGNASYGVALPYRYFSRQSWQQLVERSAVRTDAELTRLGLYVWPVDAVFGHRLHFLSRLVRRSAA